LLHGALSTTRPIVVLDEPLGTFDPLQLVDVLALLRERAASGTTLLLSVHQMSDAEKIASRVLILDAGRMLAIGTLDELRVRADMPASASLEDVFLSLLRGAHVAA
jgi:ABC-2 type transport system ATP-binding protein